MLQGPDPDDELPDRPDPRRIVAGSGACRSFLDETVPARDFSQVASRALDLVAQALEPGQLLVMSLPSAA
jgi:hypothetical protein